MQPIAHSGPVTCIEYSADSEFTVTGSDDMSLKVWETATGKLTQVNISSTTNSQRFAFTITLYYLYMDYYFRYWLNMKG